MWLDKDFSKFVYHLLLFAEKLNTNVIVLYFFNALLEAINSHLLH